MASGCDRLIKTIPSRVAAPSYARCRPNPGEIIEGLPPSLTLSSYGSLHVEHITQPAHLTALTLAVRKNASRSPSYLEERGSLSRQPFDPDVTSRADVDRLLWTEPQAQLAPFLLNNHSNDFKLHCMHAAQAKRSVHGASVHSAISDGNDAILSGTVPIDELHRGGYKVIGGISDNPEQLKNLIRTGIDGYITDRPDVLIGMLKTEISAAKTSERKRRLKDFDVEAHRGGRGLRPENTLPSFENGMDLGATTLEMDTGVSADNVSIVWHDE